MADWGDLNSGYDERERMSDKIAIIDLTKIKKFKSFRFIGPVHVYKQVWVPIFKDGKPILRKNGKPLEIPKILTNYDGEKQKFIENKVCPYQELVEKLNPYRGDKEQIRESMVFFSNVINREMQENAPENIRKPTKEEKEKGFRDMDSKHWNPLECVTMTSTAFGKAKGIMELNTVKNKEGKRIIKSLADPKYGCDVSFKFDPDAKVAANKFEIQKGDRTPLTEEELAYLLWDIGGAIKAQIDKPSNAKKEADRIWTEFAKSLKKNKNNEDGDEDDEPDDLEDDEPVVKKSKKVEDDDDEPVVKKKKKKKSKVEDEEDEDDEPVVKKKSKKVEDDDDDEPVVKKKKKSKIEDDDDEDEDDEPVVKKKSKKVEDDDDDEPVVKKKKKSKIEDDDDEDEDDDEDDDDEDLDIDD